ncbi:hypothetical protein [Thermacetogenium phaeum]|uniref:hypothetical protein n=1 Tax=Thermacetogenium phaeum TaxID=85874 RepID=UPI0002E240E9|nr:hypothetical protein [Thermacetogenium phaeum]
MDHKCRYRQSGEKGLPPAGVAPLGMLLPFLKGHNALPQRDVRRAALGYRGAAWRG